ncbi:MAG: GTP-binding protein, partial [Candidatus Faecousia sp.]|nr:GTP-binding protein [Candidatus Faecousia sp.]
RCFLLTKIDVYSGFLGAGKTTLIRKMIAEGYGTQKLVLIENEFGEIGIDGGFLQEAGIEIREMNSGCICCSLVGDFGKALEQVISQYAPDRVIIEPSGVGKLSDVIAAVKKVTNDQVQLGYTVAVADAGKCKVYMRNFGEFYNNQIETASTIVLSRTDSISQEKLDTAVSLIREHNSVATLVTTPWNQLTGGQLVEAMEHKQTLADELARLELQRLAEEEEHEEGHCCHHHDHEEEEHEGHCCHHHDHEEEEHEGHCHHHDHEEEEHEGHCHHHDHEHEEHHHEHDGEGHCCHHDHEGHHHHHHADEVFTSWGVETPRKFTKESIRAALEELEGGEMGTVLRAKGIVAAEDGTWIHFDYVPGEVDIRTGGAAVIGRLCVIGAKLDEKAIAGLFGV